VTSRRPSWIPTAGVVVLGALVFGSVALWVLARPAGQPTGRYLGEFLGVAAVLLFSCALVLATLLGFIERAFGGLDRVAQWHRRVAVVAVVLMVIHPTFAGSTPVPDLSTVGKGLGSVAMAGLVALAVWSLAPSLRAVKWSKIVQRLASISHEKWLTGHRLTGLFVIAAVLHGLLVDPVLKASTPLMVGYLTVGGIGILAYVYREVFARFVVPIYDYTVVEVQRPNETTVDVFLKPVGKALDYRPGQFVFLAFGGVGGWERHPFTVASAPTQDRLEVSIRAVGDYTQNLNQSLQPGTPAKAAGPFGGFDYQPGGQHQIWIAGGMGITPFMSWIRSMDDTFDRDVAFYYTVAHASDALYIDEISAAAVAHPTFRPTIVDSSIDGFLTADTAVTELPAGTQAWVYMCGPPAMTTALSAGFHKLKIPSSRIRWEQFNVR